MKMRFFVTFKVITVVVWSVAIHNPDPGITEVHKDDDLLHYSPVSSDSHCVLQPSDNGTEFCIRSGAIVIFSREKWFFVYHVCRTSTFLVRCYLGCGSWMEAISYDGKCKIVSPPACIGLTPRFRRFVFCLRTDEFVVESSSLIRNTDDAVTEERLRGDARYNVTFAC